MFPSVPQSPTPDESSDAPISKNGVLITRGRIKTAVDASSLYQRMWQDDYLANYNRSLVDSAIDGGPPKNPYAQIGSGGLQETNVNWGDAEKIFHEECAPIMDLIFSPEVIGSTPLKRSYADTETRNDHEEVLAEEISATIRDWPQYVPTKQREVLELKKHGIAVIYRMDENNWHWKMAGLEMFKMPRPTEIGVENLPYCGIRDDMLPEHLYNMIKDEELATAAGWNVAEVKRTLIRAAPSNPIYDDFEAWERYWKNNDYMMSYSKAVCPLVTMVIKELDGSVTVQVVNYDGSGDFLYKKEGAFGGMERFCEMYIENVGTNKYIHSIRGFGHRIYSVAQTVNRMTNQFADAVTTSGMLVFTPPNESDADEAAYMQSGGYLILNPGWMQSNVKMPDLQNSIMPGMSVFTDRLQRLGGRVGSGNSALYGDSKTNKHMFNAQMEQAALSADANLENYLATSERCFRETVRRMIRKDYLPSEPGGQAIADLKKRLHERGVPSAALEAIDWKRCKINRGVGFGSAPARLLTYDRLQTLRPTMSPDSQLLFDRDNTVAIGGVALADRYFPKPKDRRLPPAADYADVSNNQLMQGEDVPVRDGQNHVVIAQIRMEKLAELNQGIAQGGEPVLLQVVVPMHYLLDNMQKHLEKANPLDPQVKEMEKNAGSFNELVTNGLRRLQAVQQKQQNEMAHNDGKIGNQQVEGQPQQGGENVPRGTNGEAQNSEHTQKLMEASIRLQGLIEMNQIRSQGARDKNAAKLQEAAQRMQLNDIEAAADIRRSRL